MTGPRYDDPDRDAASEHVSDRSRGVALILGAIGGIFGLHRFYAGKHQSGVLMICTLGGLTFWWLYDLVLLVFGEFRDADGLPIRRWAAAEAAVPAGLRGEELRRLVEQVGRLQQDVAELAERMDFAERLLARERERRELP